MPTQISKKMYKAALEFIDDIPNDKLLGGWSGDTNNIAYGINYRLDMQKARCVPPTMKTTD